MENIFEQIKKSKLFLIAGPCVVENEDVLTTVAKEAKRICEELDILYIFKSSYKKANRTKLSSFTGIGDSEALDLLTKIKEDFSLPLITDIHTAEEARMAAEYVDILQIPAFLCRQTDLLLAAGETGKCINIKKGQFLSPEAMGFAIDKIKSTGNEQILLTERGTTFGYGDLVVDFRGIPTMKKFHQPVVLDCTHSLQRPNQKEGVTGGNPELIETITLAGIAAGADGLFIETHPDPANALSDGANMLPLDKLSALMKKVMKVHQAVH